MHVLGLVEKPVASLDEALEVLRAVAWRSRWHAVSNCCGAPQGTLNRQIWSTYMGARASDSSALVVFAVTVPRAEGGSSSARLTMVLPVDGAAFSVRRAVHALQRAQVDLAAVDCRAKMSGALGGAHMSAVVGPARPTDYARAAGTRRRFASLTALGTCLSALAEGRPHVPVRDSRLTHLLRRCLVGACDRCSAPANWRALATVAAGRR